MNDDDAIAQPAPPGVRQEIHALGGRHRGDALGGAILELGAEGLSPERKRLLQAVVRHLQPAAEAGSSPPMPSRRRLAEIGWGVVLASAATWTILVVRNLFG